MTEIWCLMVREGMKYNRDISSGEEEGRGMGKFRNTAAGVRAWYGGLSIHIKLIAAYIIIILVPVIIISNYLFAGFYRNTIKDTVKENRYQINNEKEVITGKIAAMEQSFNLLISDSQLGEYVMMKSEPEVYELMTYKAFAFSYLQRVMFNNPDIAGVRFYVNNPFIMELWPIIYHEERIKDSPLYSKVMKQPGRMLWEIESADSNSMVSMIIGSNRADNLHIGIIKIDMRIEDFFEKAYTNSSERDSRFFILDQQGNLHANNTDPLPGLDEEQIRQAVTEYKQAGKTSLVVPGGGADFLYLVEHIDKINAELVNVISLHTTYSKIGHTRNTVILVVTLLLILLAVTTYFMQSIVLKKLDVLRESMKRVRGGNFSIEVPVQGGDEIGELAHHFRQMLNTINELVADAVKRSAATKEAELQALRNQIDAHFLYNTLENLKMLSEVEGQYTIADALTSLGSIMRYNLRWTGDKVQLSDELGHIQHYISIMSIRYDEKLQLQLDVPWELQNQELPKMSLQPIVENALKHGMYSALMRREGLCVDLHAYSGEGSFYVEVTDNGTGIPEDRLAVLNEKLTMTDAEFYSLPEEAAVLKKGNGGIGLRNVNQRIRMYYGEEYGIRVESVQGSGTTVKVKLPLDNTLGGETQL
ncbi:histidine kinase [Paenibacillus sp. MMS20-IR301]|uniref:sensor histidine kinase n=1 Tax=Paenibacillus sp. MMS20-IR301 TaxID=2895946 RepID=UPI0028F09508|nr:histidine kinase [Paenibacillus sp. MMS20-IR301]WNS44177.1 histidine kinase [Paenibacillus sp. MMS20-IR301]